MKNLKTWIHGSNQAAYPLAFMAPAVASRFQRPPALPCTNPTPPRSEPRGKIDNKKGTERGRLIRRSETDSGGLYLSVSRRIRACFAHGGDYVAGVVRACDFLGGSARVATTCVSLGLAHLCVRGAERSATNETTRTTKLFDVSIDEDNQTYCAWQNKELL
jgi:hypothetical protein